MLSYKVVTGGDVEDNMHMIKSIFQAVLVFLLLTAVCLPQHLNAKHLYKYTDENGIVHVTDREPETEQPVEKRRVKAENRNSFTISNERSNGRSRQILQNLLYGPIEVQIRVLESENLLSDPPLPQSFVLPRGFRGEKVTYKARNPRRSMRVRVNATAVPGEPNVRHDSGIRYLPPFPADKSFVVSQGFNGTRTHDSIEARFAVDIPMPIGTPIRAARDGVVMEVDEDFFGAGTDLSKFGSRANSIRVLHSDGTMSVYAHLAPERVFVEPGEVILVGEKIAESGNTGFSTGPHLHFAVQRNIGMQLESIPFVFMTPAGRAVRPETRTRLHGVKLQN